MNPWTRLAIGAGWGAMLLLMLACGGPTDGEVDRAEKAVRNRLQKMAASYNVCEDKVNRDYRSYYDGISRIAAANPEKAARAIEAADRAVAEAETAMAEAEQNRDAVAAAGSRSLLVFEGNRHTVAVQENPQGMARTSQQVEMAQREVARARAEASRARAEATRLPLDSAARARADAASERLSGMRELNKRHVPELDDLMAALDEQVSNRDVMRVIKKLDGVIDDVEDNLSGIGCRP